MKCPNCGFEANGKFCENCGSPLAQNSSRKNTEGVNSFEQDNHNAVPEQPRYDYNTENRTCGQSYRIISSTVSRATADSVKIKIVRAAVSSSQIHIMAAVSSFQVLRTAKKPLL